MTSALRIEAEGCIFLRYKLVLIDSRALSKLSLDTENPLFISISRMAALVICCDS